MSIVGPDDRALLESGAAELYAEVVRAGSLPAGDERIAENGGQHTAFELLVRLGLVQLDKELDAYVPQDPGAVQSRVVSPLSQEGTRLLNESSQWATTFAQLNQTWRRSPSATSRGPVTYLRGDAIGPFLSGLVAEAEEEVLSAQPQTGRDPQTLATAALRDIEMLERGCAMRTLYQHSARRSSVTHKYVAAVTEQGAEVRTLDEFFNRIIIVDRRVAVIPSGDDLRVAIAVREPAVVAYLVDVFERAWERGRPFTNRDVTMMRDIAAEQRKMTIRMLIEGHSDVASAKRLGVSPRTYAGYIADLKAEHESETRFQLGYVMGARGVSGQEATVRGRLTHHPAEVRMQAEGGDSSLVRVTAFVVETCPARASARQCWGGGRARSRVCSAPRGACLWWCSVAQAPPRPTRAEQEVTGCRRGRVRHSPSWCRAPGRGPRCRGVRG